MDGDHVGEGYLIYRDDGRMLTPTIFDSKNALLPEGMYNFQPNSDHTLIVLPSQEKQ